MTNADRIRQMSDDELANLLYEAARFGYDDCIDRWIDWLKQEPKEGSTQ